MRFKVKERKDIKIGEERIITKILFIPVKINGEIRWLERANILQRVCSWTDANEGGYYNVYGWKNIKFVD